MTRTVMLDRGLPQLRHKDRVAWEDWLEQHGLPQPMRIPLHTEIVCDDEARTVSCWETLLNASGHEYRDGDHTACHLVTVKLEAPAAPFPPGYHD